MNFHPVRVAHWFNLMWDANASEPGRNAKAIIVLFSEQLNERLTSLFGTEVHTVWYVGDSFEQRLHLEKLVPKTAEVKSFGDRLDCAAEAIEEELLNLGDQFKVSSSDPLSWYASLVSDNSPFAGNIQLNSARYIAIHDIVCGGGAPCFCG